MIQEQYEFEIEALTRAEMHEQIEATARAYYGGAEFDYVVMVEQDAVDVRDGNGNNVRTYDGYYRGQVTTKPREMWGR